MEKKHLTVVIVLLIIAFGVYAYCYPPNLKETPQIAGSNRLTASSKSEEIRPSRLNMRLIREMVENYRQIQLKSIENSGDPVAKDANSILFDVDTLKKFINDIESAVKQNQPNEKHRLAIRMYYAAYPLKTKWDQPGYEYLKELLGDEITELYERKHTLILLPALQNGKGIYVDFNPFDLKTYNGIKRRVSNGQFLFQDNGEEDDVIALNHGQLIPPKSNEGQGF